MSWGRLRNLMMLESKASRVLPALLAWTASRVAVVAVGSLPLFVVSACYCGRKDDRLSQDESLSQARLLKVCLLVLKMSGSLVRAAQ